MGLFWLWRVVSARDNRMFPYLVLSVLCAGIVYRFMLSGGVSSIRIRPFDFMHFTLFVSLFPAHSILGLGVLVFAAAITCSLLFVPSLGALWTLRSRGQNVPFIAFSVAVFVFSASAYVMLEAAGDGQLAFMNYGSIAIMPIAAVGLMRLWDETPHALRSKVARACLIILILGSTVAASAWLLTSVATRLGLKGIEHLNWVWMLWYIAAYGLIGGAIVFFCLKLEKHYAPTLRSRAIRVVACAIPLVLTLGLVRSIEAPIPEVWAAVLDKDVLVNSSEHRGLTAALYRGLLWVRDHESLRHPGCQQPFRRPLKK